MIDVDNEHTRQAWSRLCRYTGRSRRRAGAPLRTSTWETKDGRRIRICDMADSRLRKVKR